MLIIYLVYLDKGLPFLNSDINILDYYVCLNTKDELT